MRTLRFIFASLLLTASIAGAALVATAPAAAGVDPFAICNTDAGRGNSICSNNQEQDAGNLITNIINVLLFVIGAIAVVMLIWGGVQYTVSAGDAGRVKKAKDTILYAIVGLVVAFLAFAIVNWLLRDVFNLW